MKRRITTAAAALAASVGLVLTAAPAQANHGSATIINNAASKTYILVDVECYRGALSTNTHRIYPGASTGWYDHGFVVPAGHYFSVWKGYTQTTNHAYSYGTAICITNTGTFMVRVES